MDFRPGVEGATTNRSRSGVLRAKRRARSGNGRPAWVSEPRWPIGRDLIRAAAPSGSLLEAREWLDRTASLVPDRDDPPTGSGGWGSVLSLGGRIPRWRGGWSGPRREDRGCGPLLSVGRSAGVAGGRLRRRRRLRGRSGLALGGCQRHHSVLRRGLEQRNPQRRGRRSGNERQRSRGEAQRDEEGQPSGALREPDVLHLVPPESARHSLNARKVPCVRQRWPAWIRTGDQRNHGSTPSSAGLASRIAPARRAQWTR